MRSEQAVLNSFSRCAVPTSQSPGISGARRLEIRSLLLLVCGAVGALWFPLQLALVAAAPAPGGHLMAKVGAGLRPAGHFIRLLRMAMLPAPFQASGLRYEWHGPGAV